MFYIIEFACTGNLAVFKTTRDSEDYVEFVRYVNIKEPQHGTPFSNVSIDSIKNQIVYSADSMNSLMGEFALDLL